MRSIIPRHILFGILFITGLLVCPNENHALGSPEKKGAIVPLPYEESEGFNPRLGIYYYTIKWQNMPAAETIISVSREDDYYRLIGDVKTTRIIDQIFKLRYRGEGVIRAEDYLPVETVLHQRKRSSRKQTNIRFLENGDIEIVTTKAKGRKEPTTKISKIQPDGLVLEPFSAIFLARRFNWSKGEVQSFEVITGKKIYMITLACLDKGYVHDSDKKMEAWIIQPVVVRTDKQDSESRPSNTKIYLSTNHTRDLLKIKSKTVFGTVKIKLDRFVPQTKDSTNFPLE